MWEKIRKIAVIPIFLLAGMITLFPLTVRGTNAEVEFGSDRYEKDSGEEFPMGIYIKSDREVSSYSVVVRYDRFRLDYVSGAEEAEESEGILRFTGEGDTASVKLWVTFRGISGGTAFVKVVSAEAKDLHGEQIVFTNLQSVEVQLTGEDTAAMVDEEIQELIEQTSEEVPENETDISQSVRQPEEDPIEQAEIIQDPEIAETAVEEEQSHQKIILFLLIGGAVILIILIPALIVSARRASRMCEVDRELPEEEDSDDSNHPITWLDLDDEEADEWMEDEELADEDDLQEEISPQEEIILQDDGNMQEKPVVRVQDVSMKFRVSTSNASGIKEYLIQRIRHQVSYREFMALDHVSFDVFKGEIVGIIGTNGSGKSTLLKIISGALQPTGGKVDVDRSKIQLLTLGTGFDMELSARENVYLNGAIIGYQKEFLDAHYHEIVEFAELQDFMEEKVKNFSSGMVSRLGFAIATVGDAAEILILDEVLSVGDEFFRKKSLKRIQEMIHGGSTVLMVSHGMGTILENCTKVVWIEKGKLQMVGEPKMVCDAYRQMEETKG